MDSKFWTGLVFPSLHLRVGGCLSLDRGAGQLPDTSSLLHPVSDENSSPEEGVVEPATLPRVLTSRSQQIPGLLPLLQTRQELSNPSWEVSPRPPQGGEFYCQQKDSNPPNPNLEILPVSLK